MPIVNPESPEKKGGRGRRSDYGVNKLKRNFSLTDVAHEGLLNLALDLGMDSRSKLVEALGRGEITLDLQSMLDPISQEIPIYSRFLAILEQPICRLRSSLSWTRILAYKLGLLEDTKTFCDNEDMVVEVVLKAFVIIALDDYLNPDESILDVSSTMQWLIYKMLLAKAGIKQASPDLVDFSTFLVGSSKLEQSQIGDQLNQIFNAFYRVRETYPSEYQVLYMCKIQHLSYRQIHKLMKLRNIDISEKEVMRKTRDIHKALRDAVHYMMREDIKEAIEGEKKERLFNSIKEDLYNAQYFLELIEKDDANKANWRSEEAREDLKDIEYLLLKSMFRPSLSIFLGEVMRVQGHEYRKEPGMNGSKYNKFQQESAEKISDRLGQEINKHLERLKAKIRFGGIDEKDLKEALMSVIEEVTENAEIPEIYFYKKRKYSEHYLHVYSQFSKKSA